MSLAMSSVGLTRPQAAVSPRKPDSERACCSPKTAALRTSELRVRSFIEAAPRL
jgi:hypothetical protein